MADYMELYEIGYQEELHELFEAMSKPSPLDNMAEPLDGYMWDSPDTIEDLLTEWEQPQKEVTEGDIIMTIRCTSNATGAVVDNHPHMVLITKVEQLPNDKKQYSGFIMASDKNENPKSNKKTYDASRRRSRFPNNIYYDDFQHIISRGTRKTGEGVVKVDSLVTFTSDDLAPTGTWKGKALESFIKFIYNARNNYVSGKGRENSLLYWE